MSNSKKIAIDAREFTTSTGRYTFKLIENLQKVDTAHEYYILLTPKDFATWTPSAPNFHKVECPYKEFTFAEQVGFCKQLYNLNVDLVHFAMTQQPILYLRPAVTTMHDLTTLRFINPSKNPVIFKLKQQVYKGVVRIAAHKSKHIITPSQFVKADIQSYTQVPADKISVTYESSDAIPGSPAPLDYLQNCDFIMYLGRPQPHKNLERLIEAFQVLQKQRPTLHLVLAGKKDTLYQQIETMVDQKKITNVVFTNFVSEAELRWLYENCKAYVFPSLSEGFGLPGLEAMRHGAPVVSSNATCLPEIYGDAAHYFNPLDIADMAQKISQILDDATLRQKLVTAGKIQAGKYSWQRMATQTATVYKNVLGD